MLRHTTDSVWQKGNFSARELVSHVVELLGDSELQPAPHRPGEGSPIPDQLVESFGKDQRPCILVVDDYVSDARLMRRLFEANHRFRVVEAHSAAEALSVVELTTPDLIILDLILPDLTGEQLLEMLRERTETRDIPIVVVSAKDVKPSLRAQLAPRVDSMWSKAVLDRSSLLAHVETILPE
jgi:CheY-like chemotaxis protein